jgi:pimeloyl-ACP methyl ester carboxylesterase
VNPLLSSFRKKETTAKTLYIMGAEDHMFLPSIKKLAMRFSSSELIVVPNSGHVVNIEKPVEFNEVCIEFLNASR